MSAKTALITGALGQDGRLLAGHLLKVGYRVIGLAKPGTPFPAEGILAAMQREQCGLADAPAVCRMLDAWQPDEIYHLAAVHHSSQEHAAGQSGVLQEAMLTGNFLSTKTLAFAMLETRSPAHLVFAASSQMFSADSEDRRIDEHSLRNPRTFYGHLKSWAMELLTFLRTDRGLRASSAILFNHESPLRRQQFVSRKISRAAALAKLGQPFNMTLQNLAARVDWSSARDVVRALHLMGCATGADDYVVASGQLHSVEQMLSAAFAHAGLDWHDFVNAGHRHAAPALSGCAVKLREKLGWQPVMTFNGMIGEMVNHDLADMACEEH